MIKKIKLYTAKTTNPYINLAAEKYLLDIVSDDEVILYLWQNHNTVVIGRNQNPWAECNCSLLEDEGGHLARRLSGGGAVFHDMGNLNFTFICTKENYDLSRQMKVIALACEKVGIKTELSGRNDITADGRKFSGNAFYNSKGKSYHHGTILINADSEKMSRYLTPSKAKLESKGIKSVRSRVINLCDLNKDLDCEKMKKLMADAFCEIYDLNAEVIDICDDKKIKAVSEYFGSWEFLYGTQSPFTFSCDGHFEWGNIEIKLNVIKGIIENAKVYTDSMNWELSKNIEDALCGCRFNTEEIEKRLFATLDENAAKDTAELIRENEI